MAIKCAQQLGSGRLDCHDPNRKNSNQRRGSLDGGTNDRGSGPVAITRDWLLATLKRPVLAQLHGSTGMPASGARFALRALGASFRFMKANPALMG